MCPPSNGVLNPAIHRDAKWRGYRLTPPYNWKKFLPQFPLKPSITLPNQLP